MPAIATLRCGARLRAEPREGALTPSLQPPVAQTPQRRAGVPGRRAIYGPAFLWTLVFLGSLLAVAYPSSVAHHTMVEALSAQLAAMVAALSAVRYISRRRRLYLLVSVGFLGAALLDLHHALVTSAWFLPLMPSPFERLAPWSGLAGRAYLGVLMLLAGWRLLRERQGQRSLVSDRVVSGVALVVVAGVLVGLSVVELGPAYWAGPIGRPLEFAPGALMLWGFVLALRARPWVPASFVPWLVTSMGIGAASQVAVLPFSGEVLDAAFRVGHALKICSYLSMGVGLLYSVHAAYRAETDLAGRLGEERRRLAEILWSTDAGTWEWDLRDGAMAINDRLGAIVGLTGPERDGDLHALWRSRCHEDDLEHTDDALAAHLAGDTGHYQAEFRLRHADGRWVWILDRGKVVERAEGGEALRMIGTYMDITARKSAEALAARQRDMLARDVATLQAQGRALARQADELAAAAEQQRALAFQLQREVDRRGLAEQRERHRAQHDPLTDLPNRRYLQQLGDDAVEAARADRTELAVLFIDIDGFKAVNDRLGHAFGDHLLVAIAGRLQARVRAGDVVARVGGDEFVLLLPRDSSAERAGQLAAAVVDALGAPFDLQGSEARVGASVGIALFPTHGESFEHLLRSADGAMYAVKAAGKGGWLLAPGPVAPPAAG